MATPRAVVDWLNKTYPKPKVDPEWLDACYNWLISSDASLNPATDMDRIIRNVEVQLLGSNLSDSMIPGTGLPRNVAALNNTHLPFKQSPVLVEITAITEVGHSAFSLLNTRQTRIDREDLAGLGGDEAEQEEEGPIPRYPRSMLRLEISDGTTTMRAMEYRKLPELELGETPLGYKVRVYPLTRSCMC
ncbi:hypothetical protein PLICRDRAFT_116789 [Plicaturopsis crispa FD-325 SS-3]|uniref:RecQ-mediated genome instability protein 1 n=1 Tax=Plicaturopsis crispa FD-325 SS-3 TaxID=944288 RepID=A0A0C9T9U7_PLICR|nr:hypothetical protein PLICRDRAFT_116789 [Plicaturopsis crispa FD-325 SS-3]